MLYIVKHFFSAATPAVSESVTVQWAIELGGPVTKVCLFPPHPLDHVFVTGRLKFFIHLWHQNGALSGERLSEGTSLTPGSFQSCKH